MRALDEAFLRERLVERTAPAPAGAAMPTSPCLLAASVGISLPFAYIILDEGVALQI